jgi:hypothetical protein
VGHFRVLEGDLGVPSQGRRNVSLNHPAQYKNPAFDPALAKFPGLVHRGHPQNRGPLFQKGFAYWDGPVSIGVGLYDSENERFVLQMVPDDVEIGS